MSSARPSTALPLLTRRALASSMVGGMVVAAAGPITADAATNTILDADLRDAALRGLALAGHRGDPVSAATAEAVIQRLSETDPEGALLARLYRALDVRPAAYYRVDMPAAEPENLRSVHAAIRATQPMFFSYTDADGQKSERVALPLALVHPPQGVKLLAWCEERQGYRQFFVREMRAIKLLAGDFSDRRLSLLEGLVAKEVA